MKYIKKGLAYFLCAGMLLNMNGVTAYAATTGQTDERTAEVTQEIESVDVTESVTTQEVTEAAETESESLNETAESSEETAAVSEEEASQSEEVCENVSLVNYVVVGKDYISSGESQYVFVDLSNEDNSISDAVLKYRNNTTDEELSQSVTSVDGSLFIFEIPFPNADCSGGYTLTGLDIVIGDSTVSVDFLEIGVEARFGVNIPVDLVEPDMYFTDRKEEAVEEPGVIVTSASGEEITARSIGEALDAVDMPLLQRSEDGSLVIVLDPGHGGRDNGASCFGIVEKDVNLKIAQFCRAELGKYAGIDVYMTRNSDVYVGLEERVAYAKAVHADVFISIHNNASSSGAFGAEVYYPNPSYNRSAYEVGKDLAQEIQNRLVALGLYDRGIRTRDYSPAGGASETYLYPDGSTGDYYSVIRNSKLAGFPGLIIEHAFLTHGGDAAYLSNDGSLKNLGVADATAIAKYYGLKTVGEITTVYNGIDYAPVYNFDYYMNRYADVKEAYEYSPYGALKHFVNHGMKEGRLGRADFNVKYYKNRYVDLRNNFGDDLPSYYKHYAQKGYKEGRDGKTKLTEPKGRVTKYKGVNYSAVYDFDYYQKKYSSVRKKYGTDDIATIRDFVEKGMAKGRQGSEKFDVISYAYRYYDLRKVYKNNYKKYYEHYLKTGKKKGRKATGTTVMKGGPTVYNGVDYKAVFNVGFYVNQYPKLKDVYGLDDDAYLKHFVKCGMKEGRQGSEDFNVKYYKNRYADLRSAFGNDLTKYYMHYIKSGRKEKRDGKTYCSKKGYATKLNGVDYSAVYDFNYYQQKYSDVRKAYGDDDVKTLQHFVSFGMMEGRQAIKNFNVTSYRYRYPDLRKLYRSDLKKYYTHFIKKGKAEGRKGTGMTTLKNPWTVYNGVDYSYTYDYWKFKEQYPSIAEKFGDDDYGQLEYFVKYMLSMTPIMGSTTTNVDQMVAYYNAHATYPAFYASSDAPTIREFCKIYIEESNAEGVNAALVFCQSMKETGFLRFGGQVSIEQYNFAGLGATDDGAAGASFSSVRMGVRAQVQHLKAYASTEPLKNPCVDPRFHLVTRNTAPYVEWLGIKENPYGKGWASAQRYGYSILADYLAKLMTY